MATKDFIAREARFGARNYAPLPVVLSHGHGVHLFDVEGKRYLDMMSAYSAASFGHRHPRLVAALKRQLDRLDLVSRAYYSDNLGAFCEAVATSAGLDACLPMNTGAEAVETAIKAARRYGYDRLGIAPDKAEIIVADNNFHGRTTPSSAFRAKPPIGAASAPLRRARHVPFGDAAAFEAAIGENTAAVLIEPIQGEAGIIVPPPGYLADLRRICTDAGIALIFDEVQSGLGRTGRLFAFEYENARPDGLILGKALGGGLLASSAFVATRELMDVFDPGSHGSTFGGNPLAAAVGIEALQVLEDEKLVERSARLGAILREALAQVVHPAIRAVRGKGLWVGVDLDPKQISAKEVCLAMARRGVLSKETHETVIRFAPPLVIEEADVLAGVAVFAKALEDCSRLKSGKGATIEATM